MWIYKIQIKPNQTNSREKMKGYVFVGLQWRNIYFMLQKYKSV